MELTLEQSCPSCGASIVIREDDRLIRCEYCSSNNYKCGGISGRYILPYDLPPSVDGDEVLFAPYLRFKGAVYFVKEERVQHKLIDTTRRGFDPVGGAGMPVSLGLRPQALRLRPFVSTMQGRFLSQTIPTRDVFIHAASVFDIFNEKAYKNVFHRAFIGETLSRIYQPLYLRENHCYDAVLGRKLGTCDHLASLLKSSEQKGFEWEPRFVSTHCPHCAGSLVGERDSVVLGCANCNRHWIERGGRFVKVAWNRVPAADSRVTYLPFWAIQCRVDGCHLESFGDFIRFTHQPVVIMDQHEKAPLYFWVPAFKVNPKAFLQLSTQLTLSQLRIPGERTEDHIAGYPVTLDETEAVQAIKSMMASAIVNRRKMYPLLRSINIKALDITLTYLPFQRSIHDLIQSHTGASIQTAAIKYGRSL